MKGSVLNPRGRPPGKTALTNILRRIGDEDYDEAGVKNRTALARTIWALAIAGDMSAAKLIYDRCEGLPKQTIEQIGETEVTINWDECEN